MDGAQWEQKPKPESKRKLKRGRVTQAGSRVTQVTQA